MTCDIYVYHCIWYCFTTVMIVCFCFVTTLNAREPGITQQLRDYVCHLKCAVFAVRALFICPGSADDSAEC